MKSLILVRNILTAIVLSVFCASHLCAQEKQMMNVKCRVKIHNKDNNKDRYEVVTWGYFQSLEKANEIKRKLEKLASSDSKEYTRLNREIEQIKRSNGITKKSASSGRFSTQAFPGMGFIVMTESNDIKTFAIEEGKTDYEIKIDIAEITGITKTATRKRGPVIIVIDRDNGTDLFKINIPIEKQYIKDNSRLILQAYAAECQTEDTVDYMPPIVYEGVAYHGLQDKRMDYDYYNKDRLIKQSNVGNDTLCRYKGLLYVHPDSSHFVVDTTIVYTRPDIKKTYKGPHDYSIEDFTHVYKRESLSGTCLRIRPFKFLNLAVAIPGMPLTSEFQEDADVNITNVRKNLNLEFEVGKDILKQDSLNDRIKDDIVKELRAYGDLLLAPNIIGTASPEGNEKSNADLAGRRARKAQAFISPYLPRNSRPSVSIKVYTWNDVADELDKKGLHGEAEAVRGSITSNKAATDRAVAQLPFYQAAIVPVLEQQRVMKYSYSYMREHIMDAEEVVEEYHANKRQYISGSKKFSNGDYYNLFANVTDSLELDTITALAYRHIVGLGEDFYLEKIAPFVADRMERLNQKNGVPDSMTLKPFIDDTIIMENDTLKYNIGIDTWMPNENGVRFCYNRRDIIATQAMTYYQMQNYRKAQEYVNWLKSSGKIPEGLDKLEHFMNLKNYYGLDNLSADEQDRYERGLNFVLNTSDENKAVLYTEIKNLVKLDEAEEWVDRLDDNNPKKWYLKGLLWADKDRRDNEPKLAEPDGDDDNGGFKLLSDDDEAELMGNDYSAYLKYKQEKEEYLNSHKDDMAEKDGLEDVDVSRIKHYLAYFHHCFEMQPTYKRLYFNEGHIDDGTRKLYKYRKADIPAYKKLFGMLKARDDKRRAELIGNVNTEENDKEENEDVGIDNENVGNKE